MLLYTCDQGLQVKPEYRFSCGHGQQSEDHDQETTMSHLRSFGHMTKCKADLDRDKVFGIKKLKY